MKSDLKRKHRADTMTQMTYKQACEYKAYREKKTKQKHFIYFNEQDRYVVANQAYMEQHKKDKQI